MVLEYFQNFLKIIWDSFGKQNTKTNKKIYIAGKSVGRVWQSYLYPKIIGLKNALRPCLTNTSLEQKKMFFHLLKFHPAKQDFMLMDSAHQTCRKMQCANLKHNHASNN
jgi:ABC-type arginine transport system ATPase subunit